MNAFAYPSSEMSCSYIAFLIKAATSVKGFVKGYAIGWTSWPLPSLKKTAPPEALKP